MTPDDILAHPARVLSRAYFTDRVRPVALLGSADAFAWTRDGYGSIFTAQQGDL